MLTVVDGLIKRDGQKKGWVTDHHVKSEDGAKKLGHVEGDNIMNEAEHRIAYVHEDDLVFTNDGHTVSLEHVGAHVSGNIPIIMKCLVYAVFDD